MPADPAGGDGEPRPFGRPRAPVGAEGFGASASGNVSIIFALELVPLIGLVGLGADYGMALSAKTKLDNAADAAAIAAVATAKSYIASNAGSQTDPTLTTNAIASGVDRASRAFTVNAGSIPYTTVPTPSLSLTRTNQTFTSSVAYQTSVNNNFGQIFHQNTTTISGSTSASADIPSYLDFYLLIDVSGSMGLPSTLAGQNYLAANNSNCQFACHFPGQSTGYNFATANNIQLRSGAVNTAVCGLLALAAQPLVPNQYRVGLYPFITQMGTLASITSNVSSLQTAATCNNATPTAFTTLLDIGSTQLDVNSDPSTGVGSGGTHLETALSSIYTTVSPYGSGSSALNSRPFIFLITDGMENTQYYGESQYSKYNYPGNPSLYKNYKVSAWTGSSPKAMDPSLCTTLKNAGATVSVLYIPYNVLTVTSLNTTETKMADAAVPLLSSAAQSCATSGYFYTANTPADINAALAAMFKQAVQMAHLLH